MKAANEVLSDWSWGGGVGGRHNLPSRIIKNKNLAKHAPFGMLPCRTLIKLHTLRFCAAFSRSIFWGECQVSIYIGVDIGTSATKSLAVRADGTILAEAVAGYALQHPHPLWSEQDPDDWWHATVKSVRQLVRAAKLKPSDVRGIGLSGQMHGSVFLDQQQHVIRPAILWNDQRTAAECAEIEHLAGGRKKLIRLVANPALTGFTAPKVLWLRNHEPRHYARLRHVLLPKDEIRRRLTGELATDVSDASGTLLLDVSKRNWSRALLAKLQIDSAWLPRCHESVTVTGTLRKDVARQLGLSDECFVVAGAGDCAAGAVGNGVVREGLLSASIGTSGVMFVHSNRMQFDPQGRLHTFCHAVPGKWHMMGVTLAAGGSLDWFIQTLCASLLKQHGSDVFRVLDEEAKAVPIGSEGLIYLPYLAGERTPHADPLARGCFVGLTMKHSRGHLVRSIMEGVCYSLLDSLEIISALQVPVRQIRSSGGGARSPFWLQMQADTYGQKVVTLNTEQGPAYGVALLAAVAGGEFKSVEEACGATIRANCEYRPQRTRHLQYRAVFEAYQRLYLSLKDDFRRLATLGGGNQGN